MISRDRIYPSQIERINERPVSRRCICRCERIPIPGKAISSPVQQTARQGIVRHLILNTRQYCDVIAHVKCSGYADQDGCSENQYQQLLVVCSIPAEHDGPRERYHKLVLQAYSSYGSLQNAAWLLCPSLKLRQDSATSVGLPVSYPQRHLVLRVILFSRAQDKSLYWAHESLQQPCQNSSRQAGCCRRQR